MKYKLRDSNYELLRVISMFLIVFWHTIYHGNVLSNTGGALNFVIYFLFCLVIFHVNTFILIMGYYQSRSKFKLKKFFSLLLEVGFYNLLINLILLKFKLIDYSEPYFLNSILFYNIKGYWFLSCYLITYLLSPFLNKFIEMMDRTTFKKLIMTLLICFSLIPFFTGGMLYDIDGQNVVIFVSFYFIGAYIRKYNLNNNLFKNLNLTQKRAIYIIIFLISLSFNFCLSHLQLYMTNLGNPYMSFIAKKIDSKTLTYNSPFIIMQSISIFLFFGTFQFKNKYINKIGTLTLGIYLVHENEYVAQVLYKILGIDSGKMVLGAGYIFRIIFVSIIIFIISAIIEWIRQIIFKYLDKNKFINKIKNNFCLWANELTEIKQ